MTLTILICSRPDRKMFLDQILTVVGSQLTPDLQDQVDVEIDLSKKDISEKRNGLIKDAQGKYIWFINDGDLISETAVRDILEVADKDPDIMGISGLITTNGLNPMDFVMSINHERNGPLVTGDKVIYLKTASYIAPIKREIALQIPFTTRARDWGVHLKRSGLVKTEVNIKKPIYHFRHIDRAVK